MWRVPGATLSCTRQGCPRAPGMGTWMWLCSSLGTWSRTRPSCPQTSLRVRGLNTSSTALIILESHSSQNSQRTSPRAPRAGQGINTRVTLLVAGGQLPPPQGQACWSCRPPFPPFLHPPPPPHGVPGTPGTWNLGLSDGTAEGSSLLGVAVASQGGSGGTAGTEGCPEGLGVVGGGSPAPQIPGEGPGGSVVGSRSWARWWWEG